MVHDWLGRLKNKQVYGQAKKKAPNNGRLYKKSVIGKQKIYGV